MRVWEKSYLYTLVLFVVFFFASILVIVQTSFSTMLNTQRESSMTQAQFISNAIAADISALEKRSADSPEALRNVAASYADYYNRLGISVSLTDSQGTVLSGSTAVTGLSSSENAMVCSLVSEGSDKFISITSPLQGTSSRYYLFLSKKITGIYASHDKRTAFLVSLSVGICIVLAIGLYFTLSRLYRPLNNLAHELRTPLTSIQGYAQYLQLAALSEEERFKANQYIIDESLRLEEITNSLLVMANLREGSVTKKKVDIKTIFESAKMTFKRVEYEIGQKYFFCDRSLMQSLVNNLVSNAVKASADGQAVLLRAYEGTIEVVDHGKGMSAETLAHVNNPSVKSKGGSGLGIPLCHQIAKLHKARLSFTSAPAEGTTARITFTTR